MSESEKRRKFDADVHYDVWRSGGNPDAIDRDALRDDYYAGEHAEDVATSIVRQQNARRRDVRVDENGGIDQ